MRALVSLVLLTTFLGVANAQTVQHIDVTEVGIYQTTTTKVTNTPGTASGTTATVTDVKLLKATTTVPARLHAEFGFRYRIVGRKKGAVTLKMVTLIPRPGIRNPDSGKTTVRNEFTQEKDIGVLHYRSYGMDNQWEIVPGTWTLEIWDGDRKLVSQSFNVVEP